jgi:DNA modification methylase
MQREIKVERWPVDRLIPFARNPRTHSDEQVAQIAASIAEFGWTNPILVGSDGVIIAGHARLQAARKLGLTEVPVIVLDHLSQAQRRALVIADNKLALNAGWDEELLRGLLDDLRADQFDLDLLGFSQDELDALLKGQTSIIEGLTDEDAIPEPLDEPVSQRGDLWILGDHRVMCGDSANADDMDRLMAGEQADLANNDPPYNARIEPRSNNALAAAVKVGGGPGRNQALTIRYGSFKGKPTTKKMRPKDRPLSGDFISDEEFNEMLLNCLKNMTRVLKPGGAFYLWGGFANCVNYPPILAECGLHFSQAIIWVKNMPVLTRKDFMNAHEWCFYGWKLGAAHWFNPECHNMKDVWEIAKVPATKTVHLTEKPVEIPERVIICSSRPGEIVLDQFGGSGSTLIAAEKLGRRARLMEIDPHYVDVIVRRWQDFTGKKAVLDGDGRTFEEVADGRRRVPA